MRKLLPIILWALFLYIPSFAQDSFNVHFQSGSVAFPENIQSYLHNGDLDQDQVQNRVYRYIQFYDIPNTAQRESIEKKGIKLLDYIPNKTYLASLPANANPLFLLNDLGIRSVLKPGFGEKVSKSITLDGFPDYALEGNNILLTVQFPSDLTLNWLKTELSKTFAIRLIEELSPDKLVFSIDRNNIETLRNLPYVKFIEAIAPPAIPEDLRGRALHKSNAIAMDHPMGRHYDGSGINILTRDDGSIGPHIDFTGRLNENYLTSTGNNGTHGDGVSGIFTGAGNLDPTTRGMAFGAELYVTAYNGNFSEIVPVLQDVQILITNSSYGDGCNDGYTSRSNIVDQQIFSNQSLLHVFSAGNSGGSTCGSNNYGAGSKWANITGGHKMAKNVIATANLDTDGTLEASSSRGPASDGRIKPDLAANGKDHISTTHDNEYRPFGGTSGAAPGVAGVAAQLYQAYKYLNNDTLPQSGLIKAIMLNTADDLGNKGPDFRFGWGRVNAFRAVKILEDRSYFKSSIHQGGTNSHNINVPAGVQEMKVMTYWMDPPASTLANFALVSDLNTSLTLPDNSTLLPWILDSEPNISTLNNPAQRGIDYLNNVEQISIPNPAVGNHRLNVIGHSLSQGAQEYFVIIYYVFNEIEITHPIGGESFVPFETSRIHWEASGDQGNFTIEYSADEGQTWSSVSNQIQGYQRYYDWIVPASITGKGKIRISRDALTAENPYPFNIIGVPQNLKIIQVCNANSIINWDSVSGASAYDIYRLGNKYMDSIGTTTELSYEFALPNKGWVAIRARGLEAIGRRSLAIQRDVGLPLCSGNRDISLVEIRGPLESSYSDCSQSVPVEISLLNNGAFPFSNISASYQLLGTPVVIESIPGVLTPGELKTFTFQVPLNLPQASGLYTLRVNISGLSDGNLQNNSIQHSFTINNNLLVSGPLFEDFDSFNTCPTTANCDTTVCPLINGWVNAVNNTEDQIDWRVNSGSTPSSGTGPSNDHSQRNALGQYLYLEASGGCTFQEAKLISPCIDVRNMIKPTLSLWYHMFGNSLGQLHVDLFNGTNWIQDLAVISSGRGNKWEELLLPLDQLIDSVVTIQIRGTTGAGFRSDISIDDFRLFDAGVAPIADFSTNITTICSEEPLSFLGTSSSEATTWLWSINPSTFSYTNGSTANSQNPSILFHDYGLYTVSLVTGNDFGQDTIIKQNYIHVRDGNRLPLIQDFENFSFPPNSWSIYNPDLDITWQSRVVTGLDGQLTTTGYVDNYGYNANGSTDGLRTFKIDLTSAIAPQLFFDYASARKSLDESEELEISVANNCGEIFDYRILNLSGTDLNTGDTVSNMRWNPNSNEWIRRDIDLSSHIGDVISIQFSNINGNGNSMYLDNIMVIDTAEINPVTKLISDSPEICPGEFFTFSDTSQGNNLDYVWEFGPDAFPTSATFAGPHQVQFATPGTKTIILSLTNSSGTSSDTLTVEVTPEVVSSFGFDLEPDTSYQAFTFTSMAQNADQVTWDFGDGNTSTAAQPTHTYTANGRYTITQIATNACGSDTSTQVLDISNVGMGDLFANIDIQLQPNPGDGLFALELVGGEDIQLMEFAVLTLQGQKLIDFELSPWKGARKHEIDLRDHPEGIYFLQIRLGDEVQSMKLVKQ